MASGKHRKLSSPNISAMIGISYSTFRLENVLAKAYLIDHSLRSLLMSRLPSSRNPFLVRKRYQLYRVGLIFTISTSISSSRIVPRAHPGTSSGRSICPCFSQRHSDHTAQLAIVAYLGWYLHGRLLSGRNCFRYLFCFSYMASISRKCHSPTLAFSGICVKPW